MRRATQAAAVIATGVAMAGVLAGCVSAPEVVVLDEKTALEHQAAADLPRLDAALTDAGLSPRAEPLTAGQLAAAGVASDSALARVLALWSGARAEMDAVDGLLADGCVGEALTGLLVQTPDGCDEPPDDVSPIVQRVNRNRRQLWRQLLQWRPGQQEAAVVEAWRARHLQGVVCGGQVQQADGAWARKEC